jgi:hypothetical protein
VGRRDSSIGRVFGQRRAVLGDGQHRLAEVQQLFRGRMRRVRIGHIEIVELVGRPQRADHLAGGSGKIVDSNHHSPRLDTLAWQPPQARLPSCLDRRWDCCCRSRRRTPATPRGNAASGHTVATRRPDNGGQQRRRGVHRALAPSAAQAGRIASPSESWWPGHRVGRFAPSGRR